MAKDLVVDTFSSTILDLVRRVEKLLSRQASDPRQRILVGLAGVPGSGKSTVSNRLIAELVLHGIQDVAVIPMVSCVSLVDTIVDLLMGCEGWLSLYQTCLINISGC
jgi:pantothenate kinase-related protein Tda10